MASPAAPGVDFDRNRIGQGELIAGIAGLVLLIDLWFKWYGVDKVGGSGLGGFSVSLSAWQSFGFIDILLFLIALIAIGVAVMRGINRMPDMPYPPGTLVAGAGGLAVLLILFRLLSPPGSISKGGISVDVDLGRKFGVFLGLLSAIGVAYGGWRAMQESGTSLGGGGGGVGAGAGPGAAAPTEPMPPAPPAGGDPGVPGGGAAGVGEGKAGPGVSPPGTSTGGPGGETPPAASAPDPIPGQTAGQTPPGLAGEPPAGGGTTPPGV